MSRGSESKISALVDIYRNEREREESVRRYLSHLHTVSNDLLQTRVNMVEKLLDIQVKDEMHTLRTRTNVALPNVSVHQLRNQARQTIRRETQHDMQLRKNTAMKSLSKTEKFLDSLYGLATEDELALEQSIHHLVEEYTAASLQEDQRRRREKRPNDLTLHSLEAIEHHVQLERTKEVNEQERLKNRRDAHARAQRVAKVLGPIRKDFGDLSALLNIEPVAYQTKIGVREAEVNELRQLIFVQRANEEKLTNERQAQMALIKQMREALTLEIERLAESVNHVQEEINVKLHETREIEEAQAGDESGMNERALSQEHIDLCEEEHRLRTEYEERRTHVEKCMNEKMDMDEQVTRSVDELAKLQEQYARIMEKIEDQLQSTLSRVKIIRSNVVDCTRAINKSLDTTFIKKVTLRDQKRNYRAILNTTISQLAVEEKMQQMMAARIVHVASNTKRIQTELENLTHHTQSNLQELKTELAQKSSYISQLVEILAYHLRDEQQGRPGTPQALLNRIQHLTTEWALVEWDTATLSSQNAAQEGLHDRELDIILSHVGRIRIITETLASSGIDIMHASNDSLEKARAKMYHELTECSSKEAKLNQIVRLLQERTVALQRGEVVHPLTRNVRPRTERKRIREQRRKAALERMRGSALDSLNVSRSAKNSLTNTSVHAGSSHIVGTPRTPPVASSLLTIPLAELNFSSTKGTKGKDDKSVQSALAEEHRLRVINFIKKEIQPLYDSNQITRKRFASIVESVSNNFLQQHPVADHITDLQKRELVMKIQETITIQDESKIERKEIRPFVRDLIK